MIDLTDDIRLANSVRKKAYVPCTEYAVSSFCLAWQPLKT